MDQIISPLTGRPSARVLREYDCDRLCAEWQEAFGIDIRPELEGVDQIRQCQCLDLSLVFHQPRCVAGSPALYEQLCRFDWYYQQRKWEHDVALHFCRGRQSLLEIGCGSGSFLRRAVGRWPALRAVGLEINQAVEAPEVSAGFEIVHGAFAEFAAAHEAQFDVVCSFQVLEHVVDPLEFVSLCARAARPGGLVLFGTPDARSFMRHSHNLLDLPPHHMSGWSRRAYEFLPRVAPLRLIEVRTEPLAPYHVDYYLQTWGDHFRRTNDPRKFFFTGLPGRLLRRLFRAGLRRFVKGQSILAVYEKV